MDSFPLQKPNDGAAFAYCPVRRGTDFVPNSIILVFEYGTVFPWCGGDALSERSAYSHFTVVKRLFVYNAVTQFDTTNTSIDAAPFGGAGSGVFGSVSFACGGLRFDSLGVSLLFSGRDPSSSNNMVASLATRWLRSEIRDPGLDREQARTFQQYRRMEERGKS
jgi:hypothetical protein